MLSVRFLCAILGFIMYVKLLCCESLIQTQKTSVLFSNLQLIHFRSRESKYQMQVVRTHWDAQATAGYPFPVLVQLSIPASY